MLFPCYTINKISIYFIHLASSICFSWFINKIRKANYWQNKRLIIDAIKYLLICLPNFRFRFLHISTMYEHFIFKAECDTIIMRFQNPFTTSWLCFKLTDAQTTIYITYNNMLCYTVFICCWFPFIPVLNIGCVFHVLTAVHTVSVITSKIK